MYFPYLYFDPTMLLLIPALILAIWAQVKVKSTFSKYDKLRSARGITGREAAAAILEANNINDVHIEQTPGHLSDHYDPRTKTLRLSGGVYSSDSVAALGIAAHEAGHAVQHFEGYRPIMIRNAIVPLTNIGTFLAFPLIFIGLIINNATMSATLINIGIVLYGFAVVFHLITLPVEYNASHRAIAALERAGLGYDELAGARKVLSAAAMTYVAAAAAAILQLLRLLLLSRSRRD